MSRGHPWGLCPHLAQSRDVPTPGHLDRSPGAGDEPGPRPAMSPLLLWGLFSCCPSCAMRTPILLSQWRSVSSHSVPVVPLLCHQEKFGSITFPKAVTSHPSPSLQPSSLCSIALDFSTLLLREQGTKSSPGAPSKSRAEHVWLWGSSFSTQIPSALGGLFGAL